MSQWYYADRNRQRQGPIEAGELAALFRRNEVSPDTLVWREGLEQWQVLGDFAGELGLLESAAVGAASDDDAVPTPTPTPAPAAEPASEGRAVFAASEPAHAPATDAAYAAPATPYAPPRAAVAAHDAVVRGGEVVYAGFWKRYAASVIDGLLFFVVMLVVMLVVGGLFGLGLSTLGSEMATGTLAPLMVLGIYVVPIVLQAFYFVWMHASASQATLGKLAVGIKVTDLDGNPIGTGQSLGRWAGYFFFHLLSCGIASLVSAFTTGLTGRKQALHDMAAGTLVVDRWAFTAHPERQRRELGVVTLIAIVVSALMLVGYFVLIGIAASMGGAGR